MDDCIVRRPTYERSICIEPLDGLSDGVFMIPRVHDYYWDEDLGSLLSLAVITRRSNACSCFIFNCFHKT
jgi:hypothetical protein